MVSEIKKKSKKQTTWDNHPANDETSYNKENLEIMIAEAKAVDSEEEKNFNARELADNLLSNPTSSYSQLLSFRNKKRNRSPQNTIEPEPEHSVEEQYFGIESFNNYPDIKKTNKNQPKSISSNHSIQEFEQEEELVLSEVQFIDLNLKNKEEKLFTYDENGQLIQLTDIIKPKENTKNYKKIIELDPLDNL